MREPCLDAGVQKVEECKGNMLRHHGKCLGVIGSLEVKYFTTCFYDKMLYSGKDSYTGWAVRGNQQRLLTVQTGHIVHLNRSVFSGAKNHQTSIADY